MNTIQMTSKKLAQVAVEWSEIAGETVITEVIGGILYGFCSELGALRLEHKFNSPKARAGYKAGIKGWAFVLEGSNFEMAA